MNILDGKVLEIYIRSKNIRQGIKFPNKWTVEIIIEYLRESNMLSKNLEYCISNGDEELSCDSLVRNLDINSTYFVLERV